MNKYDLADILFVLAAVLFVWSIGCLVVDNLFVLINWFFKRLS